MNKRGILYATLLCSALGTHNQSFCSQAVDPEQTASVIERALKQEFERSSTLANKFTDILICHLSFGQLLYLRKNGDALIIAKAILTDPTKISLLDPTMRSIIEKLWPNRYALLKALLPHLSRNTQALLIAKQDEIFGAIEAVLIENGIV